jgi:hypothetical protein
MSRETYLGEFKKGVERSPTEWALQLIERYGQIDGAHHKQWVIDQVARVLLGAPVEVVEARWTDYPPEERFTVGTCTAYEEWVRGQRSGADGPETYGYDEGDASVNHAERGSGGAYVHELPKEQVVKMAHLKLLRAMAVNLDWSHDYAFGAPTFDAKRPYGNSMCIEQDVAKVLGVKIDDSEKQRTKLLDLHRGTFDALKTVLASAVEMQQLVEACVVLDNGYRRCLICNHQGHSGKDDVLRHANDCALGVYLKAQDRGGKS